MAEYIEREAVIKEINRQKNIARSSFPKRNFCVSDVLTCIYTAPTADVVEVRHGVWVDYADRFWKRIGRMDLRCSLCGDRASNFVGGTEDWWDNCKPNYCPNCGAMMDGKGEK